MLIGDWSADVCSSDLARDRRSLWPADRAFLAAVRERGRDLSGAPRPALGFQDRRGTASRRARLAIPHRHHRPLRARPAYRRRPGTGRALVRPVAPDRPHLGHPQQHGDAAGAAVGSGRRDARDDPALYPDRLCMSDGSAALSSDAASVDVGTDADWQRLHPATLELSLASLGPRPVNFLPPPAETGTT